MNQLHIKMENGIVTEGCCTEHQCPLEEKKTTHTGVLPRVIRRLPAVINFIASVF